MYSKHNSFMDVFLQPIRRESLCHDRLGDSQRTLQNEFSWTDQGSTSQQYQMIIWFQTESMIFVSLYQMSKKSSGRAVLQLHKITSQKIRPKTRTEQRETSSQPLNDAPTVQGGSTVLLGSFGWVPWIVSADAGGRGSAFGKKSYDNNSNTTTTNNNNNSGLQFMVYENGKKYTQTVPKTVLSSETPFFKEFLPAQHVQKLHVLQTICIEFQKGRSGLFVFRVFSERMLQPMKMEGFKPKLCQNLCQARAKIACWAQTLLKTRKNCVFPPNTNIQKLRLNRFVSSFRSDVPDLFSCFEAFPKGG